MCELKCLLKVSPAPAFQQPHICHFSFALPSIFFLSVSFERNLRIFIKQMTRPKKFLKIFYGWKSFKFMDSLVSLFYKVTSVLQKPTGCLELNPTYNHNVIRSVRYTFIYSSLLSFSLFFTFLPDVCFFVPIVTFHLSPSNKTFTKQEKKSSILYLYGTAHFWFHKCLNSNQILSSPVCILDSLGF